jgi:hypothetical protein
MSHRTPHYCRPRLEALEERAVPSATTRPISDFINAQGTTSLFGPQSAPGVPAAGFAGYPDNIGWVTSTATNLAGNGRFARVDYSGKDAAFLSSHFGINLGTTESGTITERPLADGRAEVSVELDTKNALAWATTFSLSDTGYDSNNTTPLLFGYRPQEVVAGATPALATAHLHVVFDNTAPGAPLPDLVNAFILGNTAPGQELVALSFRADARGVAHTPTGDQPGELVVSQTGVLFRGNHYVLDGGFTAEVVSILTKKGAI